MGETVPILDGEPAPRLATTTPLTQRVWSRPDIATHILEGQQFAYNETSFMLVRLLQTFDRFELDASAQPLETINIPPASWKDVPGRQSIERCWPKAHLTLYAHGGMWIQMREALAT